jgi:hypothetical protein
MSNIFQSLINLFEIMAIGVFAISVIIYILMFIHPMYYFLIKYLTHMQQVVKSNIKYMNTINEDENEQKLPSNENSKKTILGDFHPVNILQVLGFLGLLYFSGSIANLASYSFMKGNDMKLTEWLYGEVETKIQLPDTLNKSNKPIPFQKLSTFTDDPNCYVSHRRTPSIVKGFLV